MSHAIQFENEQEEIQGIELVAGYGRVHCNPNSIFLISEAQLEILEKSEIPFLHLCHHDSKSTTTSSDLACQAAS